MKGRGFDVLLGGLAGAQLAAAAWLSPSGDRVALPSGEHLPGLCWLHEATGWQCPMCGLTRSVVAVAHGDVASALRWHAAGPMLALAMLAVAVAVIVFAIRRAPPLSSRPAFGRAFQAVAVLSLAIGLGQHGVG